MYWLIGLVFAGGVAVAPFLVSGQSRWLVLAGTLSLAAAWTVRSRPERIGLVLITAGILGVFTWSVRHFEPPIMSAREVAIEGHVTSVARQGTGTGLRLSGLSLNKKSQKGALLVFIRGSSQLQVGDQVSFSGKIARPSLIPHGWAATQVIGEVRYPAVRIIGHGDSLTALMARLHAEIARRIDQILPEPESGLLAGLLLGDRANLSAEQQRELARTGTTHIIAVSGYNVALVVAFVWLLRGWIPYRLLIGLSALSILGFVLLVGSGSSVVRAAAMGVLVLVAKALGRPATAKQLLVLVAAGMLIYNPDLLRDDLGYSLSVAATAGILWLSPRFNAVLSRVMMPALAEAVAVTLSAQLATEPIAIHAFGRISVVAIVVNLLVLPLIPIAMLAGAAALLFGAVPLVGTVVGWIGWAVLHLITTTVSQAARLPGAAVEGIHLEAWWWIALLYLVMIVLTALPDLQRSVRLRYAQ